MQENALSGRIIGCCMMVHKLLGPGLLESAYPLQAGAYLSQAIRFETRTAGQFQYRTRQRWDQENCQRSVNATEQPL